MPLEQSQQAIDRYLQLVSILETTALAKRVSKYDLIENLKAKFGINDLSELPLDKIDSAIEAVKSLPVITLHCDLNGNYFIIDEHGKKTPMLPPVPKFRLNMLT